jgi:hypothetical protein
MPDYHSSSVIGFHSCDREVGLNLLNGKDNLRSSENTWDWLGTGIYFWEQDALRALQYATENAQGKQKNRKAAKIPFVIGAIIDLGNCLNLVESKSLEILSETYNSLEYTLNNTGRRMPVNSEKNRQLDCAVINFIHQINEDEGLKPYDSIRCAFAEGEAAYPGAMITSRLHIQLCICNPDCIKGYFLPRPLTKFNPYL